MLLATLAVPVSLTAGCCSSPEAARAAAERGNATADRDRIAAELAAARAAGLAPAPDTAPTPRPAGGH